MQGSNATEAPAIQASGEAPAADLNQARLTGDLNPAQYPVPNESETPPVDPNGIPNPEGFTQIAYAIANTEQGLDAVGSANAFAPPGTEEVGGMMVDDGQQWQLALSEPKQEKGLK